MTKEQFAHLVMDSVDSLYRISKGILRNESDCEDAVWEAVARGFAKLPDLKEDQFAKTWLTRILINECYQILREKKRYTAGSGEDWENWEEGYGQDRQGNAFRGTVFQGNADREEYTELYAALLQLKELYRTPVILFYLEGYSVREIAQILQRPEGTVKSWLNRGRKLLKSILEEELS